MKVTSEKNDTPVKENEFSTIKGRSAVHVEPSGHSEGIKNNVIIPLEQANIPNGEDTGTVTQQEFNKHIINYFIYTLTPLNHIDDVNFENMFARLNIDKLGLNIMSENKLETHIDDIYVKLREAMKTEIEQLKHVCLNVYYVSGKKSRRHIITVCNWIGLDLQRKLCVLSYRKYNSDELDRVWFNWTPRGHYERIPAVGDFKKLVGEPYNLVESDLKLKSSYGVDVENLIVMLSDMSASSSKIHVQPCLYSLIPFYNKYDRKARIGTIIMHSNNLWRDMAEPQSADVVHSILGRSIDKQSVERKYNLLQQILSIRDKYTEIITALKLKENLEPDDFDFIREYLKCYEPVAEATEILLDNSFYGVTLPCVFSLKKKLLRLAKEDYVYCKHVPAEYLDELEKRYGSLFKLSTDNCIGAAVAALSHPRFKDKWFTSLDVELHYKIRAAFQVAVEEILDDDEEQTKTNEDDSFFDLGTGGNTKKSKAEVLITRYLADKDTDVSMLHRHEEIKKVFIKYNTPLPIQCNAHKMYLSDIVKDLNRSTESAETLEKMVVIQCNKIFGY